MRFFQSFSIALYKFSIKNTSQVPALFVQIKSSYNPQNVYFKDNYFILLPEEEKSVEIMVSPGVKEKFGEADISVEAWNSY